MWTDILVGLLVAGLLVTLASLVFVWFVPEDRRADIPGGAVFAALAVPLAGLLAALGYALFRQRPFEPMDRPEPDRVTRVDASLDRSREHVEEATAIKTRVTHADDRAFDAHEAELADTLLGGDDDAA